MNNPAVAPTPKISGEHGKLFQYYGLFMTLWSVLESVIQAAIMKELAVSATKAVIITGKLQFNPRAQLLANLLKHSSKPNLEAIALLNKMESFAHRNTIVHGMMVIGRSDRLTFVKYDGGASMSRSFTPSDMEKHLEALSDRVERLQALLSVTDADIQLIGDATMAFVKAAKK
ncbi:hypothetical protein P3C22_24065 [Pseudomonas sp. ER28]|uniref:hypothetical protein n=1 Tax=Pseudomonas sp. ER28 TaxID=3033801 RepID=UPI0023DF7B9F|nr:hypothetical protein [Pseudomonas sp. ER28]MDF3175060.1 hypothetical protein [Pseudomonas sp. ER28]